MVTLIHLTGGQVGWCSHLIHRCITRLRTLIWGLKHSELFYIVKVSRPVWDLKLPQVSSQVAPLQPEVWSLTIYSVDTPLLQVCRIKIYTACF
jgi:hypothetical protein